MKIPECKYFGQCGGCTSQDIPYEEQLQAKRQEAAGYINKDVDFITVDSGAPYGYRNRMDFTFGIPFHNQSGIGQREKGVWWRVVELDHCAISNDRLNTLLAEVNAVAPHMDGFDQKPGTGTFKNAVIRTPSLTSCITFIVSRDSPDLDKGRQLVRDFAKTTSADNVIFGMVPAQSGVSVAGEYEVVKGVEFLEEKLCGHTFEFHSQGFFQNNSPMAEAMVCYVRDLVAGNARDILLDLYGGVGVFGIACSPFYKEVITAEAHTGSVQSAERNIERNGCRNVRAIEMDVKNIHLVTLPEGPTDVILDPPRSGMVPKAIKRLLDRRPDRIIYISCNPKQFAAELPRFNDGGYQIDAAAMFDLFPQTPHSELVMELLPYS